MAGRENSGPARSLFKAHVRAVGQGKVTRGVRRSEEEVQATPCRRGGQVQGVPLPRGFRRFPLTPVDVPNPRRSIRHWTRLYSSQITAFRRHQRTYIQPSTDRSFPADGRPPSTQRRRTITLPRSFLVFQHVFVGSVRTQAILPAPRALVPPLVLGLLFPPPVLFPPVAGVRLLPPQLPRPLRLHVQPQAVPCRQARGGGGGHPRAQGLRRGKRE